MHKRPWCAQRYTGPMSRLSEKLRESIEEAIATGVMQPGAHLDEVELAARFGVSRTPIREAISLLAGEGLVEIRPRKGAVVASPSPQRLLEMFEVMAELEGLCARLAARRASDADLEAVRVAHEACRHSAQQQDADGYFYANERFHLAIYQAARNQFLLEQATVLQRRLRPYRRLQLRFRNRLQHSFEEHERVLSALQAGRAADAAEAMRGHVAVQGERFTDLLASLPAWEPAEAAAPAA